MNRRFCSTCKGLRDVRWSRCVDCGTDLVIGFRQRDAVLSVAFVIGLGAFLWDQKSDPLTTAFDLAMSCPDYTLTDTAWMAWFARKNVSSVSGWVLYPPISRDENPESCTRIETALRQGSKVGTLLRPIDG